VVVFRWLGVDRVYLTENAHELERTLAKSPALKAFADEGFLKLLLEPEPHAQIKVYDRCIRDLRSKYNWIAFFDLDEFLVVRECVYCSTNFSD
jgi:hypothetical protein